MSNESDTSIIVRDSDHAWGHAGPETTIEEIAAYYGSAPYAQLGYVAHPDMDTSVPITVDLLDADGDVIDFAYAEVSIPADPEAV